MKIVKARGRVVTDLVRLTDLGRLLGARRQQHLVKDGDWEKWGVVALSKKLKMDQSAIRRIESAQRYPSWHALKKICDALGLEICFQAKKGTPKIENL